MFAQITDVSAKSFDYVIIGGGTTGLALASRLTEDPSVSVVVLEAGESHVGDTNITIPGQFGNTIGNPKYDWGFTTVKQKYCNDREYLWSRGMGLGGSSSINFYAWSKPPAGDVDAFEKLGNPGWNWKEYMKYSKRSETFHQPSEEQTMLYPHTFDARHRGASGPIQVTIPHHAHTIDVLFQETLVKRGLRPISDAYGGDTTGTWIASSSLDRRDWTRSDSVSGYLLPNKHRPNLTVLTESYVTRILFNESQKLADLTATGVEFVHKSGEVHVVHARKEVVVSAGTIKSPQILELSGIGQPEVLANIGVDVKVNLPGVGENMQDHTFIGVSYELNPKNPDATFDLMFDPKHAEEAKLQYPLGKGLHTLGVTSFAYYPISQANPSEAAKLIDKAEEETRDLRMSGKISFGLAEQYRHQIATLRDNKLPDLELFAFPSHYTFITPRELGKCYFTACSLLNHPFSRGSIHCKSVDPSAQPSIDPCYFKSELDLEFLLQGIKFTRSLHQMEPWKSGVLREVDPGPECQTDDELKEYIKNHLSSAWHAVGTCSMLPREKGGVVDPQLKVYGTTNVRVVDISIVPIQIAAHTHATAYMIGEKASDIILAAAHQDLEEITARL